MARSEVRVVREARFGRVPDLVLAFNSGCGTDGDVWRGAVERILADNTPLVCTSFDQADAEAEGLIAAAPRARPADVLTDAATVRLAALDAGAATPGAFIVAGDMRACCELQCAFLNCMGFGKSGA